MSKVICIMGESGSQSRSGGNGALWPCAWTPRRQAKQLLRYSELSLEEIGERCGYKSQSYFSRVFRKKMGMSPREHMKTLI